MNECFHTGQHPDRLAAGEVHKVRPLVNVGRRGEFAEAIRLASRGGVEEVTPLHPGPFGLAMSHVSSLSKRSRGFEACSTLIPIGRGSRGANLSFLTHQVPTWKAANLEQYRRALGMRIGEFMMQVDPRSATFVYFGGEYGAEAGSGNGEPERVRSRNEWYRVVRTMTAGVVRDSAAREMTIIDRPNKPGEQADLFLDTLSATLYIERT